MKYIFKSERQYELIQWDVILVGHGFLAYNYILLTCTVCPMHNLQVLTSCMRMVPHCSTTIPLLLPLFVQKYNKSLNNANMQ